MAGRPLLANPRQSWPGAGTGLPRTRVTGGTHPAAVGREACGSAGDGQGRRCLDVVQIRCLGVSRPLSPPRCGRRGGHPPRDAHRDLRTDPEAVAEDQRGPRVAGAEGGEAHRGQEAGRWSLCPPRGLGGTTQEPPSPAAPGQPPMPLEPIPPVRTGELHHLWGRLSHFPLGPSEENLRPCLRRRLGPCSDALVPWAPLEPAQGAGKMPREGCPRGLHQAPGARVGL